MAAQDLLTTLKAMTNEQLITEVARREGMIIEMQSRHLHLKTDEQYNALLNAQRELDQLAETRNKELAAHKEELDRLKMQHEADKAAALKEQYRSVIVPIKQAEHAKQLEELKRQQAEELSAL